jgi:uncharacterized protein YeeX (DUF496 family)
MEIKMKSEVLKKLRDNKKYYDFLHENSNYYKLLNRSPDNYDKFIKDMKIKYKLRTIDKVDSFVDSVDLITKIIDASDK